MSGEAEHDWLALRLRDYLARVSPAAPGNDGVLLAARQAGDPLQAIETLQRALLPAAVDTLDADWVRARVSALAGLPADPAHALLPQLAPLSRRSMAAQPFRRPTLRRLLSALIYRPLSRVLRRVQFLARPDTR